MVPIQSLTMSDQDFLNGRKDAKPKGGYETSVTQLVLDKSGKGTGSMAAAARVKPGGETGVRIDNYADKPVQLTATAHSR